ncbi:MAG: hypothetical protein QOI64_398 [Solirubrobacteraceae bacterium]|nr:hypothetical protein [Solirubrobacteraceae bacterium]
MFLQAMPWTWTAIQNLLTAASNISKALWGQGGRHEVERQALRDSLGIDDTSPLREVAMRNHFEHYDERLDRWWAESVAHNHLDVSIMPPSTVQGMDANDMFRVFDPRHLNSSSGASGSTLSRSSTRCSGCCQSSRRRRGSLTGINRGHRRLRRRVAPGDGLARVAGEMTDSLGALRAGLDDRLRSLAAATDEWSAEMKQLLSLAGSG